MASSTLLGLATYPFDDTLNKYAQKQRLSEKEALYIFDQIIKSIYSLYLEGYTTRNIRSEHFVIQHKVCKLQTLIYNDEYAQANGVKSDYLWDCLYQAPECFGRTSFDDDEIKPMLVWNLGSILV